MYSYLYDESETWAIWQKGVSLSQFNASSDTIIAQIFLQLFDGVRDQMKDHELKMHNLRARLTSKVHDLHEHLTKYHQDLVLDEEFVRYFTLMAKYRMVILRLL